MDLLKKREGMVMDLINCPESDKNLSSYEEVEAKKKKKRFVIKCVLVVIMFSLIPIGQKVKDRLLYDEILNEMEQTDSDIIDSKVKTIKASNLFDMDITSDYKVVCFVVEIPDIVTYDYDELEVQIEELYKIVKNNIEDKYFTYGVYLEHDGFWYGSAFGFDAISVRNISTGSYDYYYEGTLAIDKICSRLSNSGMLTNEIENQLDELYANELLELTKIPDSSELIVAINDTYEIRMEKELEMAESQSSSNSNLSYKSVSTDDDEYWFAVGTAKDLVKDELKSPSTAKFPSQDYTVERSGDNWIVGGYVDAENSFGATIREEWIATFTMGDTSGATYTVSNYAVLFLN